MTDTKPGDWVVVSGIGGLGHMAVQYAKAMGLHVIAVDIAPEKLDLARSLGADMTINAAEEDPVARVQKEIRGAHGVLVTAVSRPAFGQGLGMLRRRGTMALVGLPPGDFPLPIFDVVLNAKTVRGSIVGTRMDLDDLRRGSRIRVDERGLCGDFHSFGGRAQLEAKVRANPHGDECPF